MTSEWIEFSAHDADTRYEPGGWIHPSFNSRRIRADAQPLKDIESSDMTVQRVRQRMEHLETALRSWIRNGIGQLKIRIGPGATEAPRVQSIEEDGGILQEVPFELRHDLDAPTHFRHVQSSLRDLRRLDYESIARMLQETAEKTKQSMKYMDQTQHTTIQQIKTSTANSVLEVRAAIRRATSDVQEAFQLARKARSNLDVQYQQTQENTPYAQQIREFESRRRSASQWVDAVETEIKDLSNDTSVPIVLVTTAGTLHGRSKTLLITTPSDAAYEVECIEVIIKNIISELESFCTTESQSMKLINQIENPEEREILASLNSQDASHMLEELREHVKGRTPSTIEHLVMSYLGLRSGASAAMGSSFRILQRLRRYQDQIFAALRAFVVASAEVLSAKTQCEAPYSRRLDYIRKTLSDSVSETLERGQTREKTLMDAWAQDMDMSTRALGQACVQATATLKVQCIDTLRAIITSAEKYGIELTQEANLHDDEIPDEGTLRAPRLNNSQQGISSSDSRFEVFEFSEDDPSTRDDITSSKYRGYDFQRARILRQAFRLVADMYSHLVSRSAATFLYVIRGIVFTTRPSMTQAIAPAKQKLRQLRTESI